MERVESVGETEVCVREKRSSEVEVGNIIRRSLRIRESHPSRRFDCVKNKK